MSLVLTRPISIYNKRYLVYPNGKVYSNLKKQYLTPSYNKNLKDYTYFLSISDNIPKLFFAASLIYNSFHPGVYNRSKHRIVRLDGNKKNLKLENLKLLSKQEYFLFKANSKYQVGDFEYRNDVYKDIPGINFHKISSSGKVLSFVMGAPRLCKARKAKDGSDLMSLSFDYKKQKSIYPISVAKKIFSSGF